MSQGNEDRLRILFLALTVDVGSYQGDSTHVTELVTHLRNMGHHVRLIARNSGRDNLPHDPYFHCVSRASKPHSDLLRLLQLLLSMVRCGYFVLRHARGCDLLYSRDRFSFLLALIPAKLVRKPMVYEVNGITSEQRKMHGDYLLNRLYVWLLESLDRMAFKYAARVVCVTDAIKRFYCDRFPQHEAKMATVNNGVNTRLFYPQPVDGVVSNMRTRLGFDESEEIVAYVGNLSLWQGVECLVRSVPLILGKKPDIKFMIVGHGPAYAVCLSLAEELGVGNKIRFLGQVPYRTLRDYVNVADVCVAPYTRDIPNCPIKVYEYLACGKPVVCSDIPGVDNLRDTGALVLVPPGDPDALASAILGVLVNQGARVTQKALAQSVVSEYTWTRTGEKVARICREALNKT